MYCRNKMACLHVWLWRMRLRMWHVYNTCIMYVITYNDYVCVVHWLTYDYPMGTALEWNAFCWYFAFLQVFASISADFNRLPSVWACSEQPVREQPTILVCGIFISNDESKQCDQLLPPPCNQPLAQSFANSLSHFYSSITFASPPVILSHKQVTNSSENRESEDKLAH